MASIRVFELSDGSSTFQVRWWEDGSQASATLDDESVANVFRGIVESDGSAAAYRWLRGRSEVGRPVAEVPTLDVLMDQHIEGLTGVEERTPVEYRKLYDRTWRNLVVDTSLGRERFGGLPVDLVTRPVVAAAQNMLSAPDRQPRPLSPKSVANARGLLSHALSIAVDDDAIPLSVNPCKGLRLPQQAAPVDEEDDGAEIQFLTPLEFELLLGELPEYWRPLVVTLVLTGLRWSEATALAVRHVNLSEGVVRVRRAWKKVPGGWRLGPPKSRKSRRPVAIAPEVVELLRPLVAGRRAEELVFTSVRGRRVHREHFSEDAWRPAIWRAGRCVEHRLMANPCGCVPVDRPRRCRQHRSNPASCRCPGTLQREPRIHDLRHTHVSWLIAAGVDLTVIQRRLGHESIKTTNDVYGDLLPDLQTQAAAAATGALTLLPSGGAVHGMLVDARDGAGT